MSGPISVRIVQIGDDFANRSLSLSRALFHRENENDCENENDDSGAPLIAATSRGGKYAG
jgi:hypothetical protein